jgi:PadR family transcriptional regulator, regulatory protein PadR
VTRERRPSAQTVAVLQALAEEPHRWRYGYDLCTQLGVQAGSMYPILMRLADRGLLETSWETERAPGRPPRHLYRLTGAGRAYATSTAPSATQASATRASATQAPAAQAPVAPGRTRSGKARPRLADA